MSNYSQVNDYSAKDALSTGNPLKLIKGSDIDAELSAISTAIASKFDTTSIADATEAQAGISNTVIITPGRLTSWAQNAAGVIEDIQGLSDPNDDRIIFWDDSAGAAAWLDLGAGLTISGTTLQADTGAGGTASADLTLTAGNGLSGGGDLTADRTFALDFNEPSAATPVSGDEFAFGDVDDSNTVKKVTFSDLTAAIDHDSLSGFVANEHVDHSSVTLTAGTGLSGGGDITTSRTFNLDITGLTAESTIDLDTDEIAIYDDSASAVRKASLSDVLGLELGHGRWYMSSDESTAAGTEETLVFDSEDMNTLQRGSFNTTTGVYTAGSDGAVIDVYAHATVEALNAGATFELMIEAPGTTESARAITKSEADSTPAELSVSVADLVSLTDGQTCTIRVETSSAETIDGQTARTFLRIVEVA